jgi:hypothetical protein
MIIRAIILLSLSLSLSHTHTHTHTHTHIYTHTSLHIQCLLNLKSLTPNIYTLMSLVISIEAGLQMKTQVILIIWRYNSQHYIKFTIAQTWCGQKVGHVPVFVGVTAKKASKPPLLSGWFSKLRRQISRDPVRIFGNYPAGIKVSWEFCLLGYIDMQSIEIQWEMTCCLAFPSWFLH